MTREVFYYRMVGSSRLRWRFIIGDDDTILQEGPAPEELPDQQASEPTPTTSNPAASPEVNTAASSITDRGRALLKARGIDFQENEDGTVIINHVPRKEQIISSFLRGATCPDDIPSCKQLQDAMHREIDEAGGDNCPACTKNKIHNKYRGILDNMLKSIAE